MFVFEFGVLEGPNGTYSVFYIGFINVSWNWCESLWRVASVRFLFILWCVCFMISDSLILWWFCICFVKMHLTVVGGCRMLFFLFSLQCFLMIAWSWKGQTETHYVFYRGFIDVSRKLMWEFVDGFQCSKIVFYVVFLMISNFVDFI